MFYKAIEYYLMSKVDGQMSRGNRDNCPEYSRILIYFLLRKI